MLPPGLERRSTHQYGQLIVTIKNINIPNALLETAELSFLGMKEAARIQISMDQQSSFVFGIGTNLWHFYAYLNDARALSIRLIDVKNRVYTCEMHLNLMPSHQVLSKNPNNVAMLFRKNSYLQDCQEKCSVFDNRFVKVGTATIGLDLYVYEAINRTLLQADLIDFQEILVIDEISPISSKIDLNNMTGHIQEIVPIPISSIKTPISNVPQSLRHFQQQLKTAALQVKVEDAEPSFIQDEKMIEDDIDRMIAQMQNRPYDSSKYMEQAKEEPRKENFNYANFSLVTAKSQSSEKRTERIPSTEKHPVRVPPMMKTISSRPEFNVSPQPKLAYTASHPIIGLSPMRSLSQTQITNHNQSNLRQIDRKSGLIKLKIHEFTMSKIEQQLSLLLKIYLNEDNEEFYTINGLRQGETISFNSNIKINQKRQISIIRFILIDTFDMKSIFAQGTFEMSRLFSLNPAKGIFMVNLISAPPIQNQSKIIRMQEQSLVRVTPNMKNLRIELQYEQTIEIVQIYMSLSDFSNACRKICYKVPFTKESIEFRVSELNNSKHINIFPHNRNATNKANDKIIIQLWGDTELIGLNQVSLKPLSNTNQLIINSSLQPIFLYDQAEDVVDLKTGKNRASYWLKLFYGNISQVQSILNRDDKEKRPEKPKTMVAVQNHLGIYIKQNKVQKQVQIQVDQGEMRQAWKGSQKNILSLQQQELPDDDDDEEQVQKEDHKLNISQNEFISESMEQKYLKNKQTLPILKNNAQLLSNQSKSLQFSKTIKPKPLRSLTKQFQQQIKSTLTDLASQQVFAQLKEQCRPYLLFHFIQLQHLTTIMKNMGIHQDKVNFLFSDVILVSNEMINVNILYDMIFGLILQGEVKEKLIDDVQIGRYCLMTLYKGLKQDEEETFLFDENTQFDESRKIYQTIDYKLTMREFNLIHAFIKRREEEQGASSAKLRQQLLNKHALKVKQIEVKQAKQKEIISKIYHHEWDEDDDFFICNINQREVEEPSQIMTNNDVCSSKAHENDNTGSFHATNIKQSLKFEDHSLASIKYNKLDMSRPNNQLAETFKPSQQKVKVNFKLIIQGFSSSCIDTIQCLLNTSLTLPQLRVVCRNQSQDKQFWINRTSNEDRYQIELFLDDEFVDGSIQFHDNGQCIARCNISIMSDMKSCYTLKNIETFEYCGIINILLSPL